MPQLLPRRSEARRAQAGVTLLEIMVVMVIVAIMAGAVYPSVASSLDGIRLSSSADEIVAFLNGAVERANRRQVAVEVTIDKAARTIVLHSTEPGFERRYELPSNVTLVAIEPELPGGASNSANGEVRRFYIYPGGTAPRIGVGIANHNGALRMIRIDPITGAPKIERGQVARVDE
ncbi:MAG TPA: prepilin-type N-terminal cleavage/methylation domain-containing protein [Bryobacteraceae bacterium]